MGKTLLFLPLTATTPPSPKWSHATSSSVNMSKCFWSASPWNPLGRTSTLVWLYDQFTATMCRSSFATLLHASIRFTSLVRTQDSRHVSHLLSGVSATSLPDSRTRYSRLRAWPFLSPDNANCRVLTTPSAVVPAFAPYVSSWIFLSATTAIYMSFRVAPWWCAYLSESFAPWSLLRVSSRASSRPAIFQWSRQCSSFSSHLRWECHRRLLSRLLAWFHRWIAMARSSMLRFFLPVHTPDTVQSDAAHLAWKPTTPCTRLSDFSPPYLSAAVAAPRTVRFLFLAVSTSDLLYGGLSWLATESLLAPFHDSCHSVPASSCHSSLQIAPSSASPTAAAAVLDIPLWAAQSCHPVATSR